MIDTHAHLYEKEFDSDIAEVIAKCKEAGIKKIIQPAIDSQSYSLMEALCDKYPDYLYPTMGLHPTSVTESWRSDLEEVHQLLFSNPDKYVAVGEVGMDLYWSQEFYAEQQEVLTRQAAWSLELDKPLILHVRKAYDELFEVLEQFAGKLRGIVHSFEGDERDLRRIERMGDFYIGVGGVATYKKRVARLLAAEVPLERIVLETDSPYLSPAPVQGTRNNPTNLTYVIDTISKYYNLSSEQIVSVTTENAVRLFPALG